jgi:hypothetical protein
MRGRKRLLWVLVILIVCAPGCLPRQRFNKNCEWTQDTPRTLDLADASDRRHLAEDAQLAEELATRYADFKHKEVTGYEGHGGYLQSGQVTRGCMEKMFSEIERGHGVTRKQINEARLVRDWRFDFAVLLSFVAFYLLACAAVCQALARSIGHHGPRVWLVVMGVSAVVAAVLGMELLGVWATTAEMIRVGNDHLGASRAAKSPWFNPWSRHFTELLIAGSLLFWAIAWLRGPVREQDAPSTPEPRGLALH